MKAKFIIGVILFTAGVVLNLYHRISTGEWADYNVLLLMGIGIMLISIGNKIFKLK